MPRPLTAVVSKPLFAGQTTHALSPAEFNRFCAIFSIDASYQNQLKNILTKITQTPTGAEQARQLIAFAQKRPGYRLPIKTSAEIDDYCRQYGAQDPLGGYVTPDRDFIALHSDNFNPKITTTDDAGAILLHEALHIRQTDMDADDNTVLADAETCALSFQLLSETTDFKDGYTDSFRANFQKWHKIAGNPNAPVPEGYLKFKPLPGVNQAKARRAYAHEMAARETRAQLIQDFVRPPNKWDKHALKYPSYYGYMTQQDYLAQAVTSDRLDVEQDTIDSLITRTPGLKQNDLKTETIVTNRPIRRLNGLPFSKDVSKTKQETILHEAVLNAAYGNTPLNAQTAQKAFTALDNEEKFRRTHTKAGDRIYRFIKNGRLKSKLQKGTPLTLEEMLVLDYVLVNNTPHLTQEEYLRRLINLIGDPVWDNTGLKNGRLHRQFKTELSQIIGTETVLAQNTSNMTETLRAAEHVDCTELLRENNLIQTAFGARRA